MDPEPEVLADWVSRLVQIPSVNPLQRGPNCREPGETAMAVALAEHLERFGAVDIELDEVLDGRPNVYAFVRGHTDRLVVLDAHTDTVTVENMTDPPFDGRIEDGRVWGRGALDTKASLGVMLALLESWQRDGLRPDPTLLVVGTIGEEAGGLLGATRFQARVAQRGIAIDQMVVCEPTNCAPVHGHKGAIGLRITVVGQSAHSSMPELGRNAIVGAAHIVLALEQHHRELIATPATTPVGTGTLLTSIISGGIANNVVPDRCVLQVGRRIAPYEDPAVEFDRIAQIARAACPLPIEVESLLPVAPGQPPGSPAFYQSPECELVRVFATAAGTQPACAPFGTNALRYGTMAREMIVFGPGSIDDAHKPTECVAIADLQRVAAAYTDWLRPH